MLDQTTISMWFPAVAAGEKKIFLNNAQRTQVPELLIHTLVQSLHTGRERDEEAASLGAQNKVAAFLRADASDSIIFTNSKAETLQLLAYRWGLHHFNDGDELLVSSQDDPLIAATFCRLRESMKRFGIHLAIKEFGYRNNGEFETERLLRLLTPKTRLIIVPHIHPLFGTKNEADIALIKRKAGEHTCLAVDLSYSVARVPLEVKRLQCDCAFFPGQSLFSPLSLGILYLNSAMKLDREMFSPDDEVHWLAKTAVGEAIALLENIGLEHITLYLQELSQYLLSQMKKVRCLEFLPGIGHCNEECSLGYGILSFRLPGISAEECVLLLAEHGISVDHFAVPHYPDAVTVSLHLYNTRQDIDALTDLLLQLGL
jgi:cysteine desulfurase/selenocysteine lyase